MSDDPKKPATREAPLFRLQAKVQEFDQVLGFVRGGLSIGSSAPPLPAAPAQNSPALSKTPESPRARFLRPILERKGWDRAALARASGVTYNTVRDYLNGTTTPRADTRASLADALGVKPEELPE